MRHSVRTPEEVRAAVELVFHHLTADASKSIVRALACFFSFAGRSFVTYAMDKTLRAWMLYGGANDGAVTKELFICVVTWRFSKTY